MKKSQKTETSGKNIKLFCPRCGSKMSEKDGSLVCDETGMEMSPVISSLIKKHFIGKVPISYDIKASPPNAGTWFCPGCGVRMDVSEGIVTCPRCHQSLNPFIRQLTELYFHLPIKE